MRGAFRGLQKNKRKRRKQEKKLQSKRRSFIPKGSKQKRRENGLKNYGNPDGGNYSGWGYRKYY